MNGTLISLGFSMHYKMTCCCGYQFWKIIQVISYQVIQRDKSFTNLCFGHRRITRVRATGEIRIRVLLRLTEGPRAERDNFQVTSSFHLTNPSPSSEGGSEKGDPENKYPFSDLNMTAPQYWLCLGIITTSNDI